MGQLLGYVTPAERTTEQHLAHSRFVAAMPKFEIVGNFRDDNAVNVRLFDAWKHPKVVADVGFVFPRFHQLTGSCVGAGGGQALFSLIACQRLLPTNPTKAFIPFWPFDYGRCRAEEGDRGRGEGAMGSAFAAAVAKDGVLDAATPGLPAFVNSDGLVLTEELEMQWSDGASALVTAFEPAAKKFPVGSAAEVKDVGGVRASNLNAYPCTFACNNFIGHASVQGSGSDAVLIGKWDSPGGHQQSIHGVWDHRKFGPLYWVQNNWPANSYPSDPAGGPVCGCWVKEVDVTAAFRLDAEVFALSHLTYFPAQPDVPSVLDWNV